MRQASLWCKLCTRSNAIVNAAISICITRFETVIAADVDLLTNARVSTAVSIGIHRILTFCAIGHDAATAILTAIRIGIMGKLLGPALDAHADTVVGAAVVVGVLELKPRAARSILRAATGIITIIVVAGAGHFLRTARRSHADAAIFAAVPIGIEGEPPRTAVDADADAAIDATVSISVARCKAIGAKDIYLLTLARIAAAIAVRVGRILPVRAHWNDAPAAVPAAVLV